MLQDVPMAPGSPGEQRRREKATLQLLNERLEAVLVNIRRDNIIKARQIKDFAADAKRKEDISGVVKEDVRDTDKALREVHYAKSQQLAKVAKHSNIKKEIENDLASIGAFETWASGGNGLEDLKTNYLEFCDAVANIKLTIMEASAEKQYADYLVTTIRAAIQAMEENTSNEAEKENKLKEEEARIRDQVADLKKRNEASGRKVALYEDPELEDAMQERIQLAVDRKEKQLQAELKKKIDDKAQELSAAHKASGNNAQFTPHKIDLYGEHAQLDSEIRNLEEDKAASKAKLKNAITTTQKLGERARALQEKIDNLQKAITTADNKRIALAEDAAALKSESLEDKKTRDLNKQIADQEASDTVRIARFNKAKQMLLSAVDDTETQFKTVVNLDAVLKDYERIIEDYELQYQPNKRKSLALAPPTQPRATATTLPVSAAPQSESTPTKRGRNTKPTTKPRTRSAAKSQGHPSTAGKDTTSQSRSSATDKVGKLIFPEDFTGSAKSADLSDSAESDDDSRAIYSTPAANIPYTPAESGKKKRKEPPQTVDEDAENETASTTSDFPLEITTFSALAQKVVIKNTSDTGVNLNGYKIRNCDYNISQLFPNVTLPAGASFTINPRPQNSPAKLPKYSMFWQDGDHGTFEKESKGVRVLGVHGELVCMKK